MDSEAALKQNTMDSLLASHHIVFKPKEIKIANRKGAVFFCYRVHSAFTPLSRTQNKFKVLCLLRPIMKHQFTELISKQDLFGGCGVLRQSKF